MMASSIIAPYKPLSWSIPAFRDKSRVLLYTGSAGGGKSRAAAEKLHAFMLHYPGASGLAVRKAREWATKSVVPMMQSVIGSDPRVQYIKSELAFQYANGSKLWIGGLKDDMQREALKSIGLTGGVDFIWIEEANALNEDDYQLLLTRLRGQAASWRQILLTTNPDAPTHWIKLRLIDGKEASVYYSGALDNPHNPADYIKTLEMLTGIQRLRLVEGKWVQAEGVIYDNFDPELNITFDADYNSDWSVVWGVDDGYSAGQGVGTVSYHPRVVLFGQVTPSGGLNIFDEYYATHEVDELTIQNVMERPYPKPDTALVDSSAAQLRGRLWNAGIYTIAATHKISEGIKNVRRLIRDGRDVRLLRIHPRCKELIRELQSYRYDDRSNVSHVGEPKPLKVDDHGPDALRYMAWQLRYN